MKALVTGASSGIGKEIAILLDNLGYDVIAVARREERLLDLKSQLQNNTQIYTADLSSPEECKKLFLAYPDIDVLINNAGFGVFGDFSKTDLDSELSLINLNISALHILTKLYLQRFKEKDKGYILNVASIAAFCPGPLFSSYYASKAYVYRLTRAIKRELKIAKSKVSVSLLCPGPVNTEFNDVAGVKFGMGSLSAEKAAKIAVKKMFKKKLIIVPGFSSKLIRILAKISPDFITERVVYLIQKAKVK